MCAAHVCMAVFVQGFRIEGEASFWGSCAPLCTVRVFCTGPARVFVQGLCTVAQAAAPLCAGFPRCGRRVCGRWVRGRGGFCFLFGSGECLRFSVSGVGAGVGPCVFGCWLVSLPSLALFGGLPLDPDYAVPDAKIILNFLYMMYSIDYIYELSIMRLS